VKVASERRVLVLAFDPVTEAMPGPAIRAWHLAAELAKVATVTLASTSAATRSHPTVDVCHAQGRDLDRLVDDTEIIFAPTSVVRRHDAVTRADKPLCVDMYIPTHLENLEPFGAAGDAEHRQAVAHQVAVINDDLRRGDFFLCASERQRDFWLGSLASLGRINPDTYRDDPDLRRLIDVVPFGIPDDEPAAAGPGIRGTFAGIGPNDPVAVWAGGVYNWFDPLSLIRAIDLARHRVPNIRLVFLGMRNPNPDIPEMRVARQARHLSEELGLTGTHVFFNDGWVPYDQRAAFLLDADVGVSTHLAHLETRFSFRTRVLDYLWAGLPTVLTEGDTLSEDIASKSLGVTVPPGDPPAIADALTNLISDPPARRAVREYGRAYSWSQAARPLVSYIADPRRAPDEPGATVTGPATLPAPPAPRSLASRVVRAVGRRLG
jgi:glycosyltransferase involved in cell wall biosynthesis